MMLDADIVAVSPSSVWRVLSRAGLLRKWNGKTSRKGRGFEQPPEPHQHWHIDVSYINISGTFYYLCSVLDGYSRAIVHWDLREAMREVDVEIILEAAKEKYPDATPRIISDNGPQFVAKDFKEFIRLSGMTHVRTSPYYPQSNGKLERWHKSLKGECMRPGVPLTPEDARRLDRALRRALQHGAVAQRNRVRDAGRHAGGPPKRDPGRPRPQAGAGATATSAAPSPGGLTFGVTMALPGETDAGSAGKQPCRGIARRAHRDDDRGRGSHLSRSTQNPIGSKDPDALKIPARRAASTLARNAPSPVPAEPAQIGQPSTRTTPTKTWR